MAKTHEQINAGLNSQISLLKKLANPALFANTSDRNKLSLELPVSPHTPITKEEIYSAKLESHNLHKLKINVEEEITHKSKKPKFIIKLSAPKK